MSQPPEEDDFRIERLANYSDAIARGEKPDAQGIDPVDAALVRDLHSLRRDMTPDPQLTSRLRSALADQIAAEGANSQEQQPEGDRTTDPFAPSTAATSGQTDSAHRVDASSTNQQTPTTAPPTELRPAWRPADGQAGGSRWRPPFAAIAASLLLFVTVGAGLLYLATNQNENEATLPAAAQSTETPSTTVSNVGSAVPSATASALAPITEGFLIFPEFLEESSAESNTPVAESFRTRTVAIHWDGTGIVILSGCSDRPCDLLIDDELHLEVTNSDRTEPVVLIDDNGAEDGKARALPAVLTDLFREGDNSVKAVLWDKAGNRRGLLTPVYVIILR